jgi:hypothetical protein
MDWEMIAPMVTLVVMTVTVGGVLVLRPISKRVGDLLEMNARDRSQGLENDVHQLRDLLETMDARLQLMEERQDFTERLISSGREPSPREVGSGDPPAG